MEWCLKTTKGNVENSDWVREIKHSLQELECRATVAERNVELLSSQFGALRDALIEREKCEINRRRRRRYISLLSAALIMCGGGVIKEVFESAFNLWNPEKLLSALSADRMAGFLADETTTLIFKDGVQAILQDAAVDPVEFAVVLRDAIHLERAEPVTLETPMLPPSDPEPVNPLFPPKNVNTFRAAVHSVMQRDTPNDEDTPDHPSARSSSSEVIVSSASSTTSTIDSQMSEAEMEAHPYHYAVRFSGGDFDQFQELAQYIKQDDGDINETLTMHVRLVAPDGKLNERETMEASALTYASYLGYTEIVK